MKLPQAPTNPARLTSPFLCMVFLPLLFCSDAQAGLRGSYTDAFYSPSKEYVLIAIDNIMTSKGKDGNTMDFFGKEVNIRETFPKSGVYEVQSKKFLYAIQPGEFEYSGRYYTLSNDGRYAVRFRTGPCGVPPLYNKTELGWAIRFLDNGTVIKTYRVADVIDFPCLISEDLFTEESFLADIPDWQIQNGQISIRLASHEAYTFDVATGNVLSEYRPWRIATRIGVGMLTVLALAIGYFTFKKFQAKRRLTLEGKSTQEPMELLAKNRTPFFSFGLKSLFVLTTLVAIYCALWPCRTIPSKHT